MLYAVIMRFYSLREIMASTLAEARKLGHLGIKAMPRRSTLSDANARRPADFFGAVYNDLYARNREKLSSDSRNGSVFTSAATHDSIVFAPTDFDAGDSLAMGRACIDIQKLEQLTQRKVVYVTKMKSNLRYETISDTMYMDAKNGMAYRIRDVVFTKEVKDSEPVRHRARLITYPDVKTARKKDGTERVISARLVSLLTYDFDLEAEDIIAIYKKRWSIESLFYDKFIVMQSKVRSIPDNQMFVRLLLTSTSHNNSQCPRSLSQSRRSLLFSHSLSESRLGRRSAYAFSSASRLALESALA